MVPTAFISENEVLINRTQYFLDYVLDRQEPGGWFGPEVNTTKPRYLWARYLFLYGATQLAEADPTRLNKTLNAMYSFFPLAHDMLQNGEGLNDGGWGAIRWQELAYSLQWCANSWIHVRIERTVIDMTASLQALRQLSQRPRSPPPRHNEPCPGEGR